MYTKEVSDNGIIFQVDYTVEGRHYSQTYDSPEEHPTIEIIKITVVDSEIDLMDYLTEKQITSIYESLIELV